MKEEYKGYNQHKRFSKKINKRVFGREVKEIDEVGSYDPFVGIINILKDFTKRTGFSEIRHSRKIV